MAQTQAKLDARVDQQVEGAPEFARPILRHLRALIHEVCPEVEETIKWGRPFFLYRGRIVCAFASFKQHCSFLLWGPEMAAALREAGHEVSDAAGSFGRIRTLADLPPDPTLRGWIEEAFRRAAPQPGGAATPKAVRPSRTPRTDAAPTLPEDLAAALAQRTGATDHFAAMSPSARREYIEWIEEAKRPETRARRVAESAGWIAEGKRRNWKYE